MSLSIEEIVRTVGAALEAYEAVSEWADTIAETLGTPAEQADLKHRLAKLREANDQARARRKAKLAEAAQR